MKFSSNSNINVQRCINPLFQGQQNDKHTVDYHPSPSQLTSRIYPLIFLWTPKWFISPEYFLIFFCKHVYYTMIADKFQIYGVKVTGKYICES